MVEDSKNPFDDFNAVSRSMGVPPEYLDFDIERKAIKVYHVETEMLENNIGYISLLTFDEGCAEEFKKEHGTIICRELLGLPDGADEPTPSKRTEQYYQERPCENFIKTAAKIIEKELLKEWSKSFPI